MDPATAIALFGSAQLAVKVLGPTADYLGEGIKDWTELRVQNVRRIFEKAESRIGVNADPGQPVPPKVLKHVIDEGSFSDDVLTAEYLGGVLASSKSGISRDDRGASFAALVTRLSTYQIRTHYILYRVARTLLLGSQENFGLGSTRVEHGRFFLPMETYEQAMNYEEGENPGAIIQHAIWGLAKDDLIGQSFISAGNKDHLARLVPGVPGPGILFELTAYGMELFVWANGSGRVGLPAFTDVDADFPDIDEVIVGSGSSKVADLVEQAQAG